MRGARVDARIGPGGTGTEAPIQAAGSTGRGADIVDEKLKVVVIPVSDVGRAKEFYASLGWS